MKKKLEGKIRLNESEKPYPLTEEMNDALDEAREQFQKGKYLSHKKANKEIKEWLDE